jgi:hypothetical protein
MITALHLAALASLLQSPVMEVRHRPRYYYRTRRHKPRIAPWSENVVPPVGSAVTGASGTGAQPNIVIVNTIITTGQDTFRARWDALNDTRPKIP